MMVMAMIRMTSPTISVAPTMNAANNAKTLPATTILLQNLFHGNGQTLTNTDGLEKVQKQGKDE